jgi:GTP-binding protein
MSSSAAKRAIEIYCDELKEDWEELPPIFKSSSVDGRGRVDILNYIEQLNSMTDK